MIPPLILFQMDNYKVYSSPQEETYRKSVFATNYAEKEEYIERGEIRNFRLLHRDLDKTQEEIRIRSMISNDAKINGNMRK